MSSLQAVLAQRILVMDGGMGTMIQRYALTEADYRGEHFASHDQPLLGNNDILALTRPDVLIDIHRAYLEAGADIIETCSFGANSVTQAVYGLEAWVAQLNAASAGVARAIADEFSHSTGRQVWVAGSVGPTHVSLSMATDVDDPSRRDLDFDVMVSSYEVQIEALVLAGVDFILIETIFDALNAKAAFYALSCVRQRVNRDVPVMFSVSLADSAGRLLGGQSLEGFWASVRSARPFAVSLNCGFGAEDMGAFLPRLSQFARCAVGCYPNAGLPDEEGSYAADARDFAECLGGYADASLLNLVGGCCGTTPEHIARLKQRVKGLKPRKYASYEGMVAQFSGLELCMSGDKKTSTAGPLIVAERANVTGSKKFSRLIREGAWDLALDFARHEMRSNAHLIDVCMDDALWDVSEAMLQFLRRMAAEADLARFPVVLDSSHFEVLQLGLRQLPGRSLVNSISLKEGEAEFLAKAREIRDLGAAVVVMAFDEEGQAATTDRRVGILSRGIDLLVERLGFVHSDIVVDPNILAVGTGLPEHNAQALSFIKACRVLRKRYPGLGSIGGLSNLSFAFRGRDDVRTAMHAAFLALAGDALTMVIANPRHLQSQDEISAELYELCDALVKNARPEALENLLTWMAENAAVKGEKASQEPADNIDSQTPEARLERALITGEVADLEADMRALSSKMTALEIIEGPLMAAMNVVGDKFGRAELFLPQIVKAARTMKQAIGYLDLDAQCLTEKPTLKRVLIATVQGDVHDIGKNIVSIVLACNGYEVIDLGVMVETDKIVAAALEKRVDAIGLSGLIAPSLGVMVEVAAALKKAGISVPLFVGGAATSEAHAALKIAPAYAPGVVARIHDASRVPGLLGPWLAPQTKSEIEAQIAATHAAAVLKHKAKSSSPLISLKEARENRPNYDFSKAMLDTFRDASRGLKRLEWTPKDLQERLKLEAVARTLATVRAPIEQTKSACDCPSHAGQKDARSIGVAQIHCDLTAVLEAADDLGALHCHVHAGFYSARPNGDDIVFEGVEAPPKNYTLLGYRAQTKGQVPVAIADFLPPKDGMIGLFALSCALTESEVVRLAEHCQMDVDYTRILAQSLANALVSCANDQLHDDWKNQIGVHIRPAPGYPICPDHAQKAPILEALNASQIGIQLTESFMMVPSASICGFTVFHPEIHYFSLATIGKDQDEDYKMRSNT